FALPLFPNASAEFAPIAMTLGLVGIFYGAFLAFAQTDIKRLIAFSSVAHMGFVLIGIYSGSQLALQGAVMQMLAHGVSAAALFILSGQLYERLHTRDMREMGGLWSRIAYLPAVSLFFAAASLGLPGTGNFVGEFLILLGNFASAPWITAIATSGLVFGSVYSLIMIHRAYFGPSKSDEILHGMDARELIMVVGLAGLLVYIGIYPQPFLDTSAATMHGVQQWFGTASTQLASAR
ncbi:MAG: NADH-quinone oxidoreductase subunit M, partial [Pseudomonas sp.]|nr:NADH-quinone oxidoreductase subunit M [Pseudomonas sp.]